MDEAGSVQRALVGGRILDAYRPRKRMIVILTRCLLLALLIWTLVSCAGPPRRDTLLMPYDDRLELASIYIQGGQKDKAVTLLEDAVIQEKDRPEAWAMLGELYWLKGDLKASSTNLEKALKAGGEDPVILNNLAWVESGKGNLDRALALVDRAIARDPVTLYPYLETRARILLKLERYDEAGADASAALSLTPEYDVNMRTQLEELIGEIEDRSGQEDDATY